MMMPNPLRAKHEAEFAASAIHPDLWENFITLENNKSILDYLLVGDVERTNTCRVTKKYLDRYGGLNSGWVVETNGSDFVQFKPDEPRSYIDSDGKEKSIKYESPPKYPTDIILLRHIPNWITGQKETPYWEFVKTSDCPEVWITEGAKKAGSMLSLGLPTIAVPGIFNTHTCKGGEPIPQLVELVKNKKVVNLVFDAPDKLSQNPALAKS